MKYIGVTPSEKRCVEPSENVKYIKQKYEHKIIKALYFVMNEGWIQTRKKHASIEFQKKLMAGQQIVICKFSHKKDVYLGIGRQLFNDDRVRLHPLLVFHIDKTVNFDLKTFVIDQGMHEMLASYLPVDECPAPRDIAERILKENSGLRSLAEDELTSLAWQPEKKINENHGNVFIYGFGAYARVFCLKYFAGRVHAVIDHNPETLAAYPGKDRISYFEEYQDSLESFSHCQKPIALISTYHSSHFEIARALCFANPDARVFIEKPLVVNFDDALELLALREKGFWFDVGYNRRYIPWNQEIKHMLESSKEPKIITMMVKELPIPSSHWYFWINQGTRITGNVSHWIDLAYYWLKCKPREITLLHSGDSVSLTIGFEDGSLVTIVASDRGNGLRGVQERIEIRAGEKTIFIDDYKKMVIYDEGRTRVKRKFRRDKGHDRMYKEFLHAVDRNGPPGYGDDDIFWVSYLVEKASTMLREQIQYARVDVDHQ